jgi:quercetin dioxygenase-like cupin family protein
MDQDFRFFADLAAEVQVPPDGILSRTLHNDDRLRVVLFAFSTGQELSAHTAPVPALLYIVSGEGSLSLGSEHMEAKAGSFAYMTPKLPHAIVAKSPLVMLLMMLK